MSITQYTDANGINQVPFTGIVVSKTLTPITSGVSVLPGGTYKISSGTTVKFMLTVKIAPATNTIAPANQFFKVGWKKYVFNITDTNGILSQLTPVTNDPIVQISIQ